MSYRSLPKTSRRHAAFTLLELMVSSAVASFVGLVIFAVASENLVAFEKNISINRSYGDSRRSLDRIAIALQTAGHIPVTVDATGATTAASPSAGIRFWRYGSTPLFQITTTPLLASTAVTISLVPPNSASGLPAAPPALGDMITIPQLGFQAQVTSVTSSGSTATVGFAGTLASNTSPAITTVPTTYTTTTSSGGASSQTNIQYTCLDWTSVAFIAVGNQLRYYPMFISGTSNVNTAHYEVITNLIPTAPALPFVVVPTAASTVNGLTPSSTVNIDLYAQAPDFNNRGLNTADTYTYLETALSSRNPTLLHSPY